VQNWQELLNIALVGTERQELSLTRADDAIGALLEQLDRAEKERSALRAAALLAGYRRAGFPLRADDSPPPAAEPEDRPRCRPEAAQDLARMLQGEFREALPEWLTLAAQLGRRVPEECLPDLLELGRHHSDLRAAILPVLGRRGRWLAAQNPDWKYALQFTLFEEETPEEAPDAAGIERRWQIGIRGTRAGLLAHLRRSDPAQGRALVESTWQQDAPEERAAFVKAFTDGLTMDDEPFLESALDDKRREVRREAAELLARLPESRLCLRMIARARPLLRLVRPLLKADILEVTLPEACDKALIRDGIEPKPPQGTGEKSWWLLQIVALTPLASWTRQFGKTPAEIVDANRAKEWRDTLLDAWTWATRRQRDPEWAEALLNAWIEHRGGNVTRGPVPWAEMLPKPMLEAFALRLLRTNTGPLMHAHPALPLLQQCGPTWSAELTRAVCDQMADRIQKKTGPDLSVMAYSIELFAPFVPLELSAEFQALWKQAAEPMPYLQNRLDKHLAAAQFRREMRTRLIGRP
jgi:hypothetical protein